MYLEDQNYYSLLSFADSFDVEDSEVYAQISVTNMRVSCRTSYVDITKLGDILAVASLIQSS